MACSCARKWSGDFPPNFPVRLSRTGRPFTTVVECASMANRYSHRSDIAQARSVNVRAASLRDQQKKIYETTLSTVQCFRTRSWWVAGPLVITMKSNGGIELSPRKTVWVRGCEHVATAAVGASRFNGAMVPLHSNLHGTTDTP